MTPLIKKHRNTLYGFEYYEASFTHYSFITFTLKDMLVQLYLDKFQFTKFNFNLN